MANKKISELNETSSLNNSDVMPVVQGNETKKSALSTLISFLNSKLSFLKRSNIVAGENITLTDSGSNVTISSTGGGTIKKYSGTLALVDGTPPSDLQGNTYYYIDGLTVNGTADGAFSFGIIFYWTSGSGHYIDLVTKYTKCDVPLTFGKRYMYSNGAWSVADKNETVTSITSSSTNKQIPTAKAVYDILPTIATSISSSSTNNEVAGAKAVYDFAQEKYSTTEQRIGTWYDGKPLYQKTIVTSGRLYSGSNNIPLNIDNPDWIFYKCGYIPYVDGTIKMTYTMPSYESSTSYATILNCSSSSNQITVNIGSGWGNSFKLGIVATVCYTKTTDSATTNSLNTASLMNTDSLVGMGDRAELTSLANELTDNNVGEQVSEQVETINTTNDSGDTI